MKELCSVLVSLWTSEYGGAMIEYTVLAALVVLTVAKGMGTFETKHPAEDYNTIDSDFIKDVK